MLLVERRWLVQLGVAFHRQIAIHSRITSEWTPNVGDGANGVMEPSSDRPLGDIILVQQWTRIFRPTSCPEGPPSAVGETTGNMVKALVGYASSCQNNLYDPCAIFYFYTSKYTVVP